MLPSRLPRRRSSPAGWPRRTPAELEWGSLAIPATNLPHLSAWKLPLTPRTILPANQERATNSCKKKVTRDERNAAKRQKKKSTYLPTQHRRVTSSQLMKRCAARPPRTAPRYFQNISTGRRHISGLSRSAQGARPLRLPARCPWCQPQLRQLALPPPG